MLRYTKRNHSKWFLTSLRENPNPSLLTTTLTIPSPLSTPAFYSSLLSSFHPNLNNLHPEVEKQLDNKSCLKGHTPTMFMLASPEKQWNWTVKRPVVLLAGQVSVSTFISGCHSQNNFRTVWGRHCVMFVCVHGTMYPRRLGLGAFKIPLNNTVSPNKLLGRSD